MSLTRYLLSHNHDISDQIAPGLSREDFTSVFSSATALESPYQDIQAREIEHPHWRCELKTPLTPDQMGQFLADALKTYREKMLAKPLEYKVLILGGLKTTPGTSSNPTALQPSDWGVDIVETVDDQAFLSKINWAGLVGARNPEDVIQVIV